MLSTNDIGAMLGFTAGDADTAQEANLIHACRGVARIRRVCYRDAVGTSAAARPLQLTARTEKEDEVVSSG